LLIQGEPGTGKTRFAATAPDVVFLLSDRNIRALNKYHSWPNYKGYIVIDNWNHWDTKIRPAIANRRIEAKTLCIDTGGKLFTLLEQHVAKNDVAPEGYKEWTLFKALAKRAINDTLTTTNPSGSHPGYNVIWNFHERIEKTEKGQLLGIKPDMSSNYSDTIAGDFDCSFWAECTNVGKSKNVDGKLVAVNEKKYVLNTSPDRGRSAKDGRGGGDSVFAQLPDQIPNDFNELLKLWGGN
jgi:hypothetical protein